MSNAPADAATLEREAAQGKTVEAVTLLRADHHAVDALFEQADKARSDAKKRTIVDEICKELTIHATIEEEIFYPRVLAALKDNDLVQEARVEHDSLKMLIAGLEGKDPAADPQYDAKVKVLCEYTKHHVKEEHTEMFPRANKSSLDMKALGTELMERKQELKRGYRPQG